MSHDTTLTRDVDLGLLEHVTYVKIKSSRTTAIKFVESQVAACSGAELKCAMTKENLNPGRVERYVSVLYVVCVDRTCSQRRNLKTAIGQQTRMNLLMVGTPTLNNQIV